MAKIINWLPQDLPLLRKAISNAVAAGNPTFMFTPATEMEAVELDTRYAAYLLEYLSSKLPA